MEPRPGETWIFECPTHRWSLHRATIKGVYQGLPGTFFQCRAAKPNHILIWEELVHFSDPAHVRRDRPIVLKLAGPEDDVEHLLDGTWSPKEAEPQEPRALSLDDFSQEESLEQ